ncbi:MAG: Smr/MutS family protein [Chitinophagaceae bacterium]|nr:Smr/MutS family protein [Chitinophagaceae bacterium]
MKFEKGDAVVVKHSNEDGVVEEILGKDMVLVNVRGVRFPAYTDQLDFPYYKMFKKEKTDIKPKLPKKYIEDIKREKPAPKYKVKDGVWLLLFPVFSRDVFDDDIVEGFKIFLINQTDDGLTFHFKLRFKGVIDTELQSEIPALTDFYLMDVPFEHLNDGPSFDFEFSLMSHDKKRVEYFEAGYKPKGRQLFKRIEEMKQKGDTYIDTQLFEEYPHKRVEYAPPAPEPNPLGQLHAAGFKIKPTKKEKEQSAPPSVIDLHIEKLVDDPRGLTPAEMLDVQLREFEKWLDKAKRHYLSQGWVIHGVGKGRLRDEVHEILRFRDGVKSFSQHYHPWFGNGATEVFFEVD